MIILLPVLTCFLVSFQVLESPDHAGYWTIFELICLVGGIILPSETLIQGLSHHRTEAAPLFCRESSSSKPQFVPWTTILPFASTLNCLLSKPSVFQASFPQQEGALFLSKHGNGRGGQTLLNNGFCVRDQSHDVSSC